jgi:sulfatase modifying factor 1
VRCRCWLTALELVVSWMVLAAALQGRAVAATVIPTEPGRAFSECPECPQMVVVPSGSFEKSKAILDDSPDRPDAGQRTEPAHEVSIPESFAVSRYPVTRGEYAAFVRDTRRYSAVGCKVWDGQIQWKLDLKADWANPGFKQTDRDPAVCVSGEDAEAYVRWLNARAEGSSRLWHLGVGPYRLLSWDEAEYAARGATTTPYYWGDKPYRDQANSGEDHCDPCKGVTSGRDRWIHTSPVGSFPPNPFGLYDMAGNVWTITSSRCSESFSICRIARGGSWLDKPQQMSAGAFTFFYVTDRATDVGFRVARTLATQKTDEPVSRGEPAAIGALNGKTLTVGVRFKECPDCPQMALLPPGTFYMQPQFGFPESWRPVLQTLSKPFAIGVYDVTVEEYAAFVRQTGRSGGPGCEALERGIVWVVHDSATWDHPGFHQTPRDPVVCVSWDDAQAYVRWLNSKVSTNAGDPAKGPYRLPSRQESEYAARGGSVGADDDGSGPDAFWQSYWASSYYWGGGSPREFGNFGLPLCGNCGGGVGERDQWLYTSPVGSFPPNPFGLYDVYGNVWQFTGDCYHKDSNDIPVDGSAWTQGGDCRYRIARGISYDDVPPGAQNPRFSFAGPFPVTTRNPANGFRVARTLDF